MRLFIAVNFSEDMIAGLVYLRDRLRSCSTGGGFTPPENMHLTLAFIGECDDNQANAVKAAMDNVTLKPIEVTVDRVGCFPGGIWWAGVRPDNNLLEVQKELTRKLTDAGFRLDSRPYTPHITLGRQVVTDARPYEVEPFGEAAFSIELMKSEFIRGRVVYTPIYSKHI